MTLSKRVDVLVGHQLSRWEDAGRAARFHPSVAIASFPGAGGEEVGRRVADHLHYGLFARAIVDEIARRRGVGAELLRGLDERMRSAIERYVTDSVQGRRVHEHEYFEEVARIVTAVGRRGMAVVVGRGAAFLLAPELALRVLVVAPLPVRVERFSQERGLVSERAESLVREEDARRIGFIHHHFGRKLDDPLAYDLVLNTGELELGAAAHTVADVLHRRFPDSDGPG